ncbi:MAG TPA: hypothetical protein VGW78_01290 [Candidatus Babeliales bacterium]|jgi:hypothetical protein|nr:hypothetical protein [Candidatus Babeliales bacterium]
MKILYRLLCGTSMMMPLLLNAGAGGDISPQTTANTQVLSCSGTGVTCNFVLNAVGELKNIPLKTTARTQLGAISAPRTLSIELPKINDQKLFELTLTEPFSPKPRDQALVGKPMEILFVSSQPDAEGLKQKPDALFMTKVYRRMKSQKGGLWNERATVLTNVMPTEPAVITIQPNGTCEFVLKGEKQAIHLGEA